MQLLSPVHSLSHLCRFPFSPFPLPSTALTPPHPPTVHATKIACVFELCMSVLMLQMPVGDSLVKATHIPFLPVAERGGPWFLPTPSTSSPILSDLTLISFFLLHLWLSVMSVYLCPLVYAQISLTVCLLVNLLASKPKHLNYVTGVGVE